MSKLEELAARPLRSLIEGTRTLAMLDAAERFQVARWSIKTSATLNLSSGFQRLFQVDTLKALSAKPLDIPDGFHVFAVQRMPDQPCDWLQASGVVFYSPQEILPDDEVQKRLSNDGFRVGFLIKSLCLVVVFWPHHKEWPLALWAPVHTALWPPNRDFEYVDHQYPGEVNPLDVSARLFLYRAVSNLGAISPALNGTVRLAQIKNRHTFVSGPEPAGPRQLLPIPDIITPDVENRIKEWMKSKRGS